MEILRHEILSDQVVGQGGFLAIRRLRLVNVRADGSRSAPYVCDFIERPAGVDAVVVVAWRRREGEIEVLLRDGLRPPLVIGRPEDRRPMLFRELVAGIIEPGDHGLCERAADELWEEAGLRAPSASFAELGHGVFPSAGAMVERFLFVAVEIPADTEAAPAPGDGSPYEEGARTLWLGLGRALEDCRQGVIEDVKTELGLRRLADHLAGSFPGPMR